ncbi:MAG: DUF6348 family protein [Gemmataceae bacterium]
MLPERHPANPGVATQFNFTPAGSRAPLQFDLTKLAADVLGQRGHSVRRRESWLEHPSGFLFLPQVADIQGLPDGGVHTVTTMQVNHPSLCAEGIFEYQHSAGARVDEALRNGFDGWALGDLVTLLAALEAKPSNCTFMEMSFPETEERPARIRRAILGPVAHFMSKPPKIAANEEHPFCPCCLLTNSFQTFEQFITGDGFFGLRLFAGRDEQGAPQADCRVNGEEYEPGKEALRGYARTWPAAGYEFRKQYVVLQNAEKLTAERR